MSLSCCRFSLYFQILNLINVSKQTAVSVSHSRSVVKKTKNKRVQVKPSSRTRSLENIDLWAR